MKFSKYIKYSNNKNEVSNSLEEDEGRDSLGLFYGLRHGQEDAVEQDGRHDDVVEIRMRRQVNGDSPQRIPRRKEEAGSRGRESVDVILAEPVRHHHKRLHNDKSQKDKSNK